MRRLPAVLVTLAVATAVAVVVLAHGSSSSTYRVDVVFDNARGLVPGQLLEIAGARAGTITAVTLADGYRRARIELSVDPRFAPFRTTANCTIRPQGLIAENYVACDPGRSGHPLAGRGGHAPTVPVTQTTEPVTLTDLFNIANLPTRERFTVLLSELGVGTAARGLDINAILRRVNPSLALARRVIAVLQSQRAALDQTLADTDPVVAQLSQRRAQVRAFVSASARVTGRLAAHRGALGAAVHRLPALLSAARPALAQVNTLATQSPPLLIGLRDTAPLVQRLSADLKPLVTASRPALAKLGHALTRGAVVARRLTPTTRLLQGYERGSLPTAQLMARLFANLEQTGFWDSFLAFVYHAAAASARFDSVSHILPAHVAFSQCSNYATTPVSGCSAHFTPTSGAPAPNARRDAARALLHFLLR